MLAVMVGLVFVVAGVWGIALWWHNFVVVMTGLIPAMVVCGGIISVVAGLTSIWDSIVVRQKIESEEKK